MGMEGSLKLKEISYIHSEAYAAGELKHGTISLIEPGALVVALAGCTALFEKLMSNVVEVKSRGADVLGVTMASHGAEMEKTVDHGMAVPDTLPMLLPAFGSAPAAAVGLLYCADAGLRHRQTEKSGQVRHCGIRRQRRPDRQAGTALYSFRDWKNF